MKKILIAEDDKFLQNIYKVKLTKAGYEVIVVNDGKEFIDKLETFDPNLILLDLVMPVKDGFSVLGAIKNNPKTKGIPVIVASNLGQDEDIRKAMSLGATDYIVKSDTILSGVIEKIEYLL